jgi:hypothetical protein
MRRADKAKRKRQLVDTLDAIYKGAIALMLGTLLFSFGGCSGDAGVFKSVGVIHCYLPNSKEPVVIKGMLHYRISREGTYGRDSKGNSFEFSPSVPCHAFQEDQ